MKILQCLTLALALALALAGCAEQASAPPSPARPDGASAPVPATPPAAPSAAIQVPPPDTGARSSVASPIALPPSDTATQPLAEGADIIYSCEDGSDLRVAYSGGRANITMPHAAIVLAPLSPAASREDGGEVYVGDLVGLRRIGDVVELQQHGAATRRCREAGASA